MERKTTYQRLREAGLCVTCRAPAVQGKSRCEACAKKSVERASRWYKQHKEESKEYWRKRYFNNCIAGKCPLCGAPAEEGHTACRACMDKNKQRYHDNRVAGICTRCRKNAAAEGRALCLDCIDKLKQWRERT